VSKTVIVNESIPPEKVCFGFTLKRKMKIYLLINNNLTIYTSLIFKINATFALMKKGRNIILNILILIIVFFSLGIGTRSNSEVQRCFIEHSICSNNFENKLSHHIDISDEDQMDQSYIILLPDQHESQEYGLSALLFLNNFSFSVWQPPKVF
jgi:hypothetical protein